MATAPTQTAEQSSAQLEQWKAPSGDQEFVFESVDKAPSWINKDWASFDRGPALAVPAGDIYGAPPYTTKIARVGDKVVFTAAKGAMPARFDVIPGDPIAVGPARKPPQQSPAALEDMLRLGVLTPEDLGADGKAQVAARTPSLKGLIEGEVEAVAEPQSIADQLKLD